MKKSFLVVLVAVLVAALSAPAWAVDINGFNTIRAWSSNGRSNSGNFLSDKDADKTNSFVEQRARMKFTFGDENVKFVYQNEIDSVWGTSSYDNATNKSTSAGALGTDGINLETKNLYLWFKAPANVQILAGLVNLTDPYAGIIYGGADMAAVAAITDIGPVNLTLAWSKWAEGTVANADDADVYFAIAKFAPAKDMSLGVNLHYVSDRTASQTTGTTIGLWIPGVDFTGTFGPAKVNAFAFYQSGKIESASSDIDIAGYAADVRADITAGPGNAFVEGLYVSGGDNGGYNDDGDKFESIVTASQYASGSSFYSRSGLNILFRNPSDIGSGNELFGGTMRNYGHGLMLAAAGYGMKFSDTLSGKLAVGYARAAATEEGVSKDIGTELNGAVEYTIQKGLTLGLNAGYAMLGKFYGEGVDEVADIWQANWALKYTF